MALEVAGDTLTAKQLKATYEAATDTKLTEKQLGSIAEFQAWITAKKRQPVRSKSTFTTSIFTRWYRARANLTTLGTIAILTSNP